MADDVRVIRLDTSIRPVICIGFGGPGSTEPYQMNYFCSIHSNNQFNQAFRTILRTESFLTAIGRTLRIPVSWMLLGDFNRSNPRDLMNAIATEEVETNFSRDFNRWLVAPANANNELMQTQMSGGTLDYAFVGSTRGYMPTMVSQVETGTSQASDHNLVRYYPLTLTPNTPRPDLQAPSSSNSGRWLGAAALAFVVGSIFSGA